MKAIVITALSGLTETSKPEPYFLAASKDIKVGDVVHDEFGSHAEIGKVKEIRTDEYDLPCYIIQGFDGVPECTSRVVKIIGELSPNATWVKDGEEIEIMDIPSGANDSPPANKAYYKVKCPTCNTYH